MRALLACQEIYLFILRRKLVAGDAIGGGALAALLRNQLPKRRFVTF